MVLLSSVFLNHHILKTEILKYNFISQHLHNICVTTQLTRENRANLKPVGIGKEKVIYFLSNKRSFGKSTQEMEKWVLSDKKKYYRKMTL